jgi:hypothetical protein
MKLISMTTFVLEQYEISRNPTSFEEKAFKYANFLKQPLELWMFIPCDEEGNVLEEPNEEFELSYWDYSTKSSKYQQAKERCLFEGFEYLAGLNAVRNQDCQAIIFTSFMSSECVEKFTEYGFQLTKTAIKQLEL